MPPDCRQVAHERNLKSLGRFALMLADGRMITPCRPAARKAPVQSVAGLTSAPESRGNVAMMDYPAVSAKAATARSIR